MVGTGGALIGKTKFRLVYGTQLMFYGHFWMGDKIKKFMSPIFDCLPSVYKNTSALDTIKTYLFGIATPPCWHVLSLASPNLSINPYAQRKRRNYAKLC